MPKQEPHTKEECRNFSPRGPRDLLLRDAASEIEQWLALSRMDLACIADRGPECDRKDKPPALAIGQEQLHRCARHRVCECRKAGTCSLLDYTAETTSKLGLRYLRERFKGYPDQRLASNILEEVRLEADVEHQVVLHLNIASIVDGYDSVQETVRELKQMKFYDFYADLPFVPLYVIGQGSRMKKLGVKKYRRTSDFSAPHKDIRDNASRRVIPVNDASKCYLRPEWLTRPASPKVREWDASRYKHVQWQDEAARKASPRHKFPK